MRLSIVHLTTYLQGGAGRAITDLACAQHAAGHRVLVMSSATDVPGLGRRSLGGGGYGNYPHYLERLADAGVDVILEDSLFTRDATLNLRALDRLKTARPFGTVDILHAHAGTPARIGLAYVQDCNEGTVVIQTQHGWGSNKTECQAHEDLEVLRRVNRVVVTSETTLELLVEYGVPSDHLLTIPCGIPPVTAAVSAAAEMALAPLRTNGYSIVGCVGTVNANKNQQLLLEALPRQDGSVAAVFVGEGAEELRRRAEHMGIANRVLAVGYQPDAERWMPAFDALVVPSFSEGQGLVVLEAFRAGVPVVASAIPSLRQLVVPEHTGWLFDPHDACSLATVIERVVSLSPSERARVTRAARASFLANYTAEQMVLKHEQLYRRLRAA
jgi:glycosyltransferase involved in cell wall biosynthesis